MRANRAEVRTEGVGGWVVTQGGGGNATEGEENVQGSLGVA